MRSSGQSRRGKEGQRVGLGPECFGCLTACLVAVIHLGTFARSAELIVGLVYFVVAWVLALMGRRQISRATPPVPAEAVERTKEDVQWLKTQAKSARPWRRAG
jgi:hypothetical protein